MAVQTGEAGLSGRYIVAGSPKQAILPVSVSRRSSGTVGVIPPACFEMLALLSFLNTIRIFIMIRFILMVIMV